MNEQITDKQVNLEGHLTIAGCDAIELAHEYGTPLIVYDVEKIRKQIRAFKQVFEQNKVAYVISYASKAFASIAMYQVIAQENIHSDVVSGGELYTAIIAGFPMQNLSFHGNNKSKQELEMAVKHQVGMIIIDNFYEIELLNSVLEKYDTTIKVLLRIAPGISAHTNKYIQTGQVDSKFGFDLQSGQADKAVKQVLNSPRMQLQGLHAHIGSQIFETVGFKSVAQKLVQIAASWQEKFDYQSNIINVGGGFGIKYTKDDQPLAPENFVQSIIDAIKHEIAKTTLPMPEIWIEPGRSIVGSAGYNLYTVGSRKDIPGYLPYVTVDGGMGDNIRPALYQAKYETVLASDPKKKLQEHVKLAGKYCESGDILSYDQPLPITHPGDILAMLDTGAYGYSMASNYNRNLKPAVVFAENGKAQIVIKRQTYEDLISLDEPYTNY